MSIVPHPYWMRDGREAFALSSCRGIACADAFTPGLFRAARLLQDELRERFEARVDILPRRERPKRGILLGLMDSSEAATALPAALRRRGSGLGPEGYALSTRRDGVVIAGRDAAGVFYGVQTLLQIVEGTGRDARACGVDVLDWPAHPWRGVHLYVPPKSRVDEFKRLIRFLALCKMNTVVLETGGAVELKRHPEVNRAWQAFASRVRRYPWGQGAFQAFQRLHGRGKDSVHACNGGGSWLSQDEVRELVAFARELHVQIVPEIQSLTHCYWLCMVHPEIAEWSEDRHPDTYCPCNPRSYELLFDCMDELLGLFQSEWAHIGHDEWYFIGVCPRCRRLPAWRLLADDLRRIHGFLAERGVRCVMWADKLINPDECRVKRLREWGTGRWIRWGGGKRTLKDAEGAYRMGATWRAVDRAPDDLLMMDWYWGLSPDTERYFARHGKDVVFGNFEPFRFRDYGRRGYAPNVKGGVFSSWVENSRLSLAHMNWPLVAAVSADMLWSEVYRRSRPQERMSVFREFWSAQRDRLDLPEERLVTRRPGKARFRAVRLPVHASSGIEAPAVVLTPGATPFDLARSRPVVVGPEDRRGPTIRIGRPVRGIVFLHGLTMRPADAPASPLYDALSYEDYYRSRTVGHYTLVGQGRVPSAYEVAKTGRIPIRLGFEVGCLFEPAGLVRESRPGFADWIPAGDGVTLYAYEWVNPNPDYMVLSEIAFERETSPGLPGTYVLYAVTLVL